MAVPQSRNEFSEYCLRRLGKGAITINVTADQVDDRIDEALTFWSQYHFDGIQKVYYKVLITDQIKSDKFITLPNNIIGALKIFEIGSALGTGDIFNITYQIALNDLYTLTSQSMIPYFMSMQHIQFMQQLLVGQKPIRYNRHTNKLYVDMNWDTVQVGTYLIVDAYQTLDPDTYTDIWGDRWLIRYATALIKRQWGDNLSKFPNLPMVGGIQFNGANIVQEAQEEIDKVEQEMMNFPLSDQVYMG